MKKAEQVDLKLNGLDDPLRRELEAFFHKAKGKPLQDEIKFATIEALANAKDWTAVKGEVKWKGKRGSISFPILVEFIRQRAEASDRLFFVKLGRALEGKRGPKNAAVNEFLFRNWDRIQGSVDGKRAVSREDIGLKHFTDNAVVKMLEIRFPD